jgi:hypothetical protein
MDAAGSLRHCQFGRELNDDIIEVAGTFIGIA